MYKIFYQYKDATGLAGIGHTIISISSRDRFLLGAMHLLSGTNPPTQAVYIKRAIFRGSVAEPEQHGGVLGHLRAQIVYKKCNDVS